MSDQNIVTLSVSDDTEMQAYSAFPSSTGPVAGIILLQEAFGVNHHIRSVADRLAAAGYAVIAPELFHRTATPGQEFAYSDFSSAMPHYSAINNEDLRRRASQGIGIVMLAHPEAVEAQAVGQLGQLYGFEQGLPRRGPRANGRLVEHVEADFRGRGH